MLLSVQDITKTYPSSGAKVQILRGVDLTLEAGQAMALTGESGSGKSTLLHLCAGLDQPDQGAIRVQGRDITQLSDARRAAYRRDQVGLVFQQFNLIPSLSVADNIAFQARLAGRWDSDWGAQLVQILGLQDQLKKYPEQLSGGQQQRVAIGRALAARPALILADEPTGNLDEATSDAVLDLLLTLVRESGAGMLMVTHSERLAARLEHRRNLSGGMVV